MQLRRTILIAAAIVASAHALAQNATQPLPPEVSAVGTGLAALQGQLQTVITNAQMMDNYYRSELRTRDEAAKQLKSYWNSYAEGSQQKSKYWRSWVGLPPEAAAPPAGTNPPDSLKMAPPMPRKATTTDKSEH